MYSNERYRIPETSPGRRFTDQRMSSGGRSHPDPRDSVRPQARERRSLESDRRGFETDRRDRMESLGRRSQDFDYNHSRQPERRDFERNRMEDEGKRKMAEELKIREQQLAITSNLLQKQSAMLKNIEANMMTRKPGPSPMMGRNMVHSGPNMGPMDMRPDTRSPRRNFEFNNDMDRYDGPPPKRFKEIGQGERSNWKNAGQSRGGRAGSQMTGGPIVKTCNICLSPNHIARFCPKSTTNGHESNRPSIDQVCNICKSPHHFARDCPENVMVNNGKVCNICKSPNHFQRSCPKNSPKNNFSGPKRDIKSSPVGFNKSFGTTSRFASTRGRRPFQSDKLRGKFTGNSKTKSCKVCSIYGVREFETHLKSAEHIKWTDLCSTGCKLCNKKRYNSKPQYEKHQVSTLHKALVGKKKLVVESKLKPYSASNVSGVEYVVPVSGFFCKLCKKFYNKESYAKVDHCKTKPHYEKVASMLGTKFETAIGARFQDIKDKLSAEETDQQQLERKLIEAVRKADFVTDLKPIPKKKVAPKAPAASATSESTDKTTETNKSAEANTEVTVKHEEENKPEETSEGAKEAEDAEEESEEKPIEDDGDNEHPDDLEMEVLDDVGGDDGAGAD